MEHVPNMEVLKQFPSVLTLNVGGVIHTTRLSTIRKYPDSMLGAMFSGRYPVLKDKDGNFFIDRDGTYFIHILNFLRDERCLPPPKFAQEVMKEVMFYGIGELEKRMRLYKDLFEDYVVWEHVRKKIEDYSKKLAHLISIGCSAHLERGKIPNAPVLLEIQMEDEATFRDHDKQYRKVVQRNDLQFKQYVSVKAKTYEHALNVRGCFIHDLHKGGYKFTVEPLHPSYIDLNIDQYTHHPMMIFNVLNFLFIFEWS